MDENPYRAPLEVGYEQPATKRSFAGRASGGRFLAAQIDHAFVVVLFLGVGMNLGEIVGNIPTGIAALAAYLGYYFVPEWLFGTTAGKALFSLRVKQLSGEPCTARQIAVRTAMRLVEVNPFLLGALPAGIAILSTKRRQRLGDLLAGTIVVRRNDIKSNTR
jgi:uncharacterized RDD family membrane protein YckC